MKLMLVRCLFDGTAYEHAFGSSECCPVCGRITYDVLIEDLELIICSVF